MEKQIGLIFLFALSSAVKVERLELKRLLEQNALCFCLYSYNPSKRVLLIPGYHSWGLAVLTPNYFSICLKCFPCAFLFSVYVQLG